MNTKEFFALAKERGISEAQFQSSSSKSLSVTIYEGEVDNYQVDNTHSIIACGIYNGKFGSARSEKTTKDAFPFLVDGIIKSASLNEKVEAVSLFAGSEKYHKKNVLSKSLATTPVEKKIGLARYIEKRIREHGENLTQIEVTYSESEEQSEFCNSTGLKLRERGNYFVISASLGAIDGETVRTSYELAFGNELETFDPDEFVARVIKGVLSKIGASPCETGSYPTVLKNSVFSRLLRYFIGAMSSEEIQKKSSYLEGRLGDLVASRKLTVEERPLDKNIFFSFFDDEGVAKTNKTLIKRGRLQTYLYNRETAKKDGVSSTGNGSWAGSKMGISSSSIVVKPGKRPFAEMIAPIETGVYITELEGLGTGMNSRSGNFSCQAQGFLIKNGKLDRPLTLITISGNLISLLKDIVEIDSETELLIQGVSSPNVLIKKMPIGGI